MPRLWSPRPRPLPTGSGPVPSASARTPCAPHPCAEVDRARPRLVAGVRSRLVADAGEAADRRGRHAAAGALGRVGLEEQGADGALTAVERALVDLLADLVLRDHGALEDDLRRHRVGRVADDRLLAAGPLHQRHTGGLAGGARARALRRDERRDGAAGRRAALAAHAVAELAGERVGERVGRAVRTLDELGVAG